MAESTTKKHSEPRFPGFWPGCRSFTRYLTVKGLIILYIFLSSNRSLQAQQLAGIVKNKTTMQPLDGVAIRNQRTSDLYYSDAAGHFIIYARPGDTIRFSQPGYFDYEYIAVPGKTTGARIIRLTPNMELLDTVSITGPLTKYQAGTLERQKTYRKQLKQQKEPFKVYENKLVARSTFGITFDGILSSLFQKRARKYKRLWRFQKRFYEQEQLLYINSRYNVAIIQNLTGLSEEEANSFMERYPMDTDFISAATERELEMQILYNYRQWKQKSSLRPDTVLKAR